MSDKLFGQFIIVVSLILGIAYNSNAQGWDSEYEGVMLQGFYWDSFEDTKWTNLTSQADELSAYFDLIWVPNSASSGYNSMGYMPQYWFRHDSSFGTSAELRNMIDTYKKKGTGILADVIINHRNGVNSWYDFPVETDHNGNTWSLGLWAICGNDEMAYAEGQPSPTGAYDEGDNFDGCRDLDHTNGYVQEAIKAYLDFLLNDLGYAGFRYDMSKGYAPYYTGLYNDAVKPRFSVGEYFDGNYDLVKAWIDATIRNNAIQSAAYDFPLKFKMNTAFAYPSDFTNLATYYNGSQQPNGMIKEPGFRRFSVTFIDNHDTYRDGSKFSNDAYVMAANAFILCNPGTPCVFLPHWKSNKDAIKRLIDVRKSVGVHNQSAIEVWEVTQGHYAAKVYGKNGDLFIKVGYDDYSPYGYDSNDIVAFGEGYCVWTKTKIESAEDKIIPSNNKDGFAVYVKKSTVPESWSSVYCYAWTGESTRLTAVFPGNPMDATVTIEGEKYYKFTFDSSTSNANIVLSSGDGSQTVDVTGITGDAYYAISSSANADNKYEVEKISVTSGEEIIEPISVYLLKDENTASWSNVYYYAWDNDNNPIIGSWPGKKITDVVTCGDGNDYYCYTFDSSYTGVNIIFNNGSGNQTVDIKGVVETGFYRINSSSGKTITVTRINNDNLTTIETVERSENHLIEYFNLQGVRVENPQKGLYIRKQGGNFEKVIF